MTFFNASPLSETAIVKRIPDVTGPEGVDRILKSVAIANLGSDSVVRIAEKLENQVKMPVFKKMSQDKQDVIINKIRATRLNAAGIKY